MGESKVDFIGVLEEVIEQVRSGRPVPLSASVLINRKQVLERLEQILESTPDELAKALLIVNEQDEVLARTQREAKQVLERARAEKARMLETTQVEGAATREADRIIKLARGRAREIRAEAEHDVDGKLATFEAALQKMLAVAERTTPLSRGRLGRAAAQQRGRASAAADQNISRK